METGSLERSIGVKRVESNTEKTKMMISSENVGKVTMADKFPSAVYRKGLTIYSILCQFWRCWVNKRCGGFRGKLKKDKEFKCHACANQRIDMA